MAWGDGVDYGFDAGLALADPAAAAALGVSGAGGDYGVPADSSVSGYGDGAYGSGGNQSGQTLSPEEQAALALSDPEAAAAIGVGSSVGDYASNPDFYSDAGNYDRQTDVRVATPRSGLEGFIDSLIGINRSATSFRDGTMGPVEGRFNFFDSPLVGILATLVNPALGAAYGVGRSASRGDVLGAVLSGAGLVGQFVAPFSNITTALGMLNTGNSIYGMLNNGQPLTAGFSDDLGLDMSFLRGSDGEWSAPGFGEFPGDAVSVTADYQQDAPNEAPSADVSAPTAPTETSSATASQSPDTSAPGTQSYLSPGLRRTTYGNIQTGDTAPSDEGATNRGYAGRPGARWRQASARLAA